jgi:hypothetical protein
VIVFHPDFIGYSMSCAWMISSEHFYFYPRFLAFQYSMTSRFSGWVIKNEKPDKTESLFIESSFSGTSAFSVSKP